MLLWELLARRWLWWYHLPSRLGGATIMIVESLGVDVTNHLKNVNVWEDSETRHVFWSLQVLDILPISHISSPPRTKK